MMLYDDPAGGKKSNEMAKRVGNVSELDKKYSFVGRFMGVRIS